MPAPRKKTLQPRKRPTQARSTETVTVILTAAAHILEKEGYDRYSTNAIAGRAGVSIGSLYQYFPGKDAITIALIQQDSARLAEAIHVASRIDDWQDALRAMIDIAVRHQLDRPALARILDLETSRLQPESSAGEIAAWVSSVLARGFPGIQAHVLHTIASDVVAIARGLTDSAAEQADLSLDALRYRLDCAVFGYLDRAAGTGLKRT